MNTKSDYLNIFHYIKVSKFWINNNIRNKIRTNHFHRDMNLAYCEKSFSNTNKLRDACKKEGHRLKFTIGWSVNNSTKFISLHQSISLEPHSKRYRVHLCDWLFLTHDKPNGKTYKAVLNIMNVSSRFKAFLSHLKIV